MSFSLVYEAMEHRISPIITMHCGKHQLPDVPFHIFAATKGNEFRKPNIGMWSCLTVIYAKQDVTPGMVRFFLLGHLLPIVVPRAVQPACVCTRPVGTVHFV
jgi:hypothetical protein